MASAPSPASPNSVCGAQVEDQAGLGVADHGDRAGRQAAARIEPRLVQGGDHPLRQPQGVQPRSEAGGDRRMGDNAQGQGRQPAPRAAPATARCAAPAKPLQHGQHLRRLRPGQACRLAVIRLQHTDRPRPGRRPATMRQAGADPGARAADRPRQRQRRQPGQGGVGRQRIVRQLGRQQFEHQPGRDQPGQGEAHPRFGAGLPALDQGRRQQRLAGKNSRMANRLCSPAARRGRRRRAPAWAPGRRLWRRSRTRRRS